MYSIENLKVRPATMAALRALNFKDVRKVRKLGTEGLMLLARGSAPAYRELVEAIKAS